MCFAWTFHYRVGRMYDDSDEGVSTVVGSPPPTVVGSHPHTVVGSHPPTVVGSHPPTVVGSRPPAVAGSHRSISMEGWTNEETRWWISQGEESGDEELMDVRIEPDGIPAVAGTQPMPAGPPQPGM